MTTPEKPENQTVEIDPARLAHGTWCHAHERTLGEGDIAASYSGDRISEGKPVRAPFEWQGGIWVCTGSDGRGGVIREAYRLVHPSQFPRSITSYGEKVRAGDGEIARHDPNGFYDGMAVRHGKATLILCGPPVSFVPGQQAQMDLFGEI